MRIIAGEFRGFPLAAPKGKGTRPTTDRVRESVMSAVASARGGFEGATVLDAFAGSGALGLETLSRGAARAVLCDTSPDAVRALNANVGKLRLPDGRARVLKADMLRNPLRAKGAIPEGCLFDLVFLDPPYAYRAGDVLGVVARLREGGAMAEGAVVVYEHAAADAGEADADAAAGTAGLRLARRRRYGDTVVDMLALSERGED